MPDPSPPVDPKTIEQITALIDAMTVEARQIVTELFRSDQIGAEDKSDNSPVTQADMRIEAKWRDMIAQAFPDHSIMGEEYDDSLNEGAFTWVLDPIDGTRQFIYGMPLFGSLIGVLHEQTPVIGSIDIPVLKEQWLGIAGQQSTLNGKAVATSSKTQLDQALLMATAPAMFGAIERNQFGRLVGMCRDLRFGTDCYAYGLLAGGHCDLVAEAGMKNVDIMALVPVVEQAGGIITDWSGQKCRNDGDGTVLASANSTLHELALCALSPTL